MDVDGDYTCEDCKWWGAERKHDHHGPYGKCRAKPPILTQPKALTYHDPDRPEVAGPIVDMARWPWTAFDDWCGGFTLPFKPLKDQPHD